MPISMLFWFLYVIFILFGGWAYYQPDPNRGRWPLGGHLLLCILIFLLGWHVFGFVIKGEGEIMQQLTCPGSTSARMCRSCESVRDVGHGFVPHGRRKQEFVRPEVQKIIDDASAAGAVVDAQDQLITQLKQQIADLTKPKAVTLSGIQIVAPQKQYWYEARSQNDPHTGPHGTATILSGEPAVVDFHPVNLGGPSDNVYLPREMYATLSPAERLLMETAKNFSIGCTWLVDNWQAPQALELDYQIRKSSGVLINIGLQFIPLGGSWTLGGLIMWARAG